MVLEELPHREWKLVFKAHRLCVPLNSRRESNKERREWKLLFLGYRGTSLIRNTPLLGPYSRTIPRVIWLS